MYNCENCGARNPPEQDEFLQDYDGEYFCSDECREQARQREEGHYEEYS